MSGTISVPDAAYEYKLTGYTPPVFPRRREERDGAATNWSPAGSHARFISVTLISLRLIPFDNTPVTAQVS